MPRLRAADAATRCASATANLRLWERLIISAIINRWFAAVRKSGCWVRRVECMLMINQRINWHDSDAGNACALIFEGIANEVWLLIEPT